MKSGPKPTPFAVRFFRLVSPEPNTGCWLWTGFIGPCGYGEFRVDGHVRAAHRISFALEIGPIPDGLFVCHRCDVRSCVNPAHLFLGTAADNNADKVAKGRQASGENNNAKLTADEVRVIRRLCGVPQRHIAAAFGVCQAVVSRIRLGQTWRHIDAQ